MVRLEGISEVDCERMASKVGETWERRRFQKGEWSVTVIAAARLNGGRQISIDLGNMS